MSSAVSYGNVPGQKTIGGEASEMPTYGVKIPLKQVKQVIFPRIRY